MSAKTLILIFGVTGDLAKKKLLPAIYDLMHGQAPDNFLIVGAASRATTMNTILAEAKKDIPHVDHVRWQMFTRQCFYQQTDINNADDFVQLATFIKELEQKKGGAWNHLIYCATNSAFFGPITQQLAENGILERTQKDALVWHRIAYEKPFGHDGASAQQLQDLVTTYVDEEQIYRVDHYLSKELVQLMPIILSLETKLHPYWNSEYVQSIMVYALEEDDVHSRGASYDATGALADVVQNHLLALLAMATMSYDGHAGDLANRRAELLEDVRVETCLLGQYEGYRHEKRVSPLSQTETFAELGLTLDNDQWRDVPFYVTTGKALGCKRTGIYIQFKDTIKLEAEGIVVPVDTIMFKLYPQPGFYLQNNKLGLVPFMLIAALGFPVFPLLSERCNAYESVLKAMMQNDHRFAVGFAEVKNGWRIVDAIRACKLPVHSYARGSTGPKYKSCC